MHCLISRVTTEENDHVPAQWTSSGRRACLFLVCLAIADSDWCGRFGRVLSTGACWACWIFIGRSTGIRAKISRNILNLFETWALYSFVRSEVWTLKSRSLWKSWIERRLSSLVIFWTFENAGRFSWPGFQSSARLLCMFKMFKFRMSWCGVSSKVWAWHGKIPGGSWVGQESAAGRHIEIKLSQC